jgi:hypothetical protein
LKTEAYWHAHNSWIFEQMDSCMSTLSAGYRNGADYNTMNKNIEWLMEYSIELLQDNHKEQEYQLKKAKEEALQCANPHSS